MIEYLLTFLSFSIAFLIYKLFTIEKILTKLLLTALEDKVKIIVNDE